MKAFQNFLRQFPHYTDNVYEQVLPKVSSITLNPNEYFLKDGQTCQKLAFIEEGLVRIYYLNDGKEITKCFCKENNITTAYSSMITQTPSQCSIQAIEETKLITLSYSSLQQLYQESIFW